MDKEREWGKYLSMTMKVVLGVSKNSFKYTILGCEILLKRFNSEITSSFRVADLVKLATLIAYLTPSWMCMPSFTTQKVPLQERLELLISHGIDGSMTPKRKNGF